MLSHSPRTWALPIPSLSSTLRLSFLLLLLAGGSLHAQKEYNVWYFGNGAGLDFNSGAPVVLTDGMMTQLEGCASIADHATGALLFYTNGVTIWDRRHVEMPNGGSLGGHWSSTQSALIVPSISDTSIYYLFTVDQEGNESSPSRGASYSVIDMRLNGGFGDVVQHAIPLQKNAEEKLTAVGHCNGRDYWIVVHSLGGNTFYSYLLTDTGLVITPVVSRAGTLQGPLKGGSWTMGYLKASPDGLKLAMVCREIGLMELFSFNPETGEVSSPIQLHPAVRNGLAYAYGLSFSPDGSRLYIGWGRKLLQYSLAWDNSDSVDKSETLVNDATTLTRGEAFFAMQNGPDGRLYAIASDIYSGAQNPTWLSVVPQPNQQGAGCGFIEQGVLVPDRRLKIGLPNNFDGRGQCLPLTIDMSLQDTSFCQGGCLLATGSSVGEPTTWVWSFDGGTPRVWYDSTPPVVCYSQPGRYRVSLVGGRWGRVDSTEGFVTVFPSPQVDAGEDILFCSEGPLVDSLHGIVSGGTGPYNYAWSPAVGLSCADCAEPEIHWSGVEEYILTVTDANGCSASDRVEVRKVEQVVIHAHMNRGITVLPGDTAWVPVVLDDSLDAQNSGRLHLRVRFDSTAVRPVQYSPSIFEEMLGGGLLEGWEIRVVSVSHEDLELLLLSPDQAVSLHGVGTLLYLPFITFIPQRDTLSSPELRVEFPFELQPSPSICLTMQTSPGEVELRICGLNWRLIEPIGGAGVLKPNVPNPFTISTVIPFSLSVGNRTALTVWSAQGGMVDNLLDGWLPAGDHEIHWDASAFPRGVYFYRLVSGDRVEVGRMVVVR